MATTRKGAPAEEVDPYAIDREKTAADAGGGARFWKIKDGKNLIRLFPVKGRGVFYVRVAQHFIKGPDGFVSFLCRGAMEDGECYACEVMAQLRRTDEDLAEELRPKWQYYSAVVDLNEADKGLQVYRYGISVFRQINNLLDSDDYREMLHPTRGRNLTVEKVKKGSKAWEVEYQIVPGGTVRPYPDLAILDEVAPLLDSLVVFEPREKQKRALTFLTYGGVAEKNPVVKVEDLPFEDQDDEDQDEDADETGDEDDDEYTVASETRTSSVRDRIARLRPR